MDITYLLWLQDLREATPWLVKILSVFCDLNVVLFPAICFFLYLSVDKRTGLWGLLSVHVSEIANLLVKNICCVYRPYVKDTRLTPPTKSTSYSFPSGHTMYATSTLGTIGVWQRKKHVWITVICVFLILVTGFARNYLGVHTPQDVVVSVILTGLCVWLCHKILQHLAENPDHRLPAILIGAAVGIIVLVFLECKPYPMDYDADGKLLVDPYNTKTEVYQCIGKWLGFLIAMVIDIQFTHYAIPEKKAVRYIGGAVGAVLSFAGSVAIHKLKTFPFGDHWGGLLVGLLIWAVVYGVYPLILIKLSGSRKEE
ncbi:MAG: phosphatase PAP2 family protein [Oscillospiraceae bacterium]|nr:phosphatase PAP2 family protein [Oscillospiraceae bacterium]